MDETRLNNDEKQHVPYSRLSQEVDVLVPRPSILLPHLQESEKKFFELVASGDVLAVSEYLDKNAGFNINCVNFQGVSALLIAVQNHSEPMVEFLLRQPGIDIGDCVLHAIKDNQRKILEGLLQKLSDISPSLEFVGVTHSTDFPDYVTPLILAAQCGHYEIIDFSSTLKTFFWAILCMAPLESADVIIENLPGETPKTTIINKHGFTEAVGYICFALFEVLIVVMILNMLIATMSSTFQRVLDNLDVEWTFGKSDFYLEYMLQSTTPSPLNLIPTPGGVTVFMEMMNGTRTAGNVELGGGGCCQRKPTEKDSLDKNVNPLEYPALMSLLVQRYFREKDEANQAASEIDLLRQEIHELKALLNDIIAEKEE